MKISENLVSRRGFCVAGVSLATIGFSRLAEADEADSDTMITQLAKFKLNMENEEEGLQALKDLCTAVEENEPGVLAYICHRSAKNPDELVFFEVYKDEEALKAHGTTRAHGQDADVVSQAVPSARSRLPAWIASRASRARVLMNTNANLTTERRTFVSHLECGLEKDRYDADRTHGLSKAGKPLLVRYDLDGAAFGSWQGRIRRAAAGHLAVPRVSAGAAQSRTSSAWAKCHTPLDSHCRGCRPAAAH